MLTDSIIPQFRFAAIDSPSGRAQERENRRRLSIRSLTGFTCSDAWLRARRQAETFPTGLSPPGPVLPGVLPKKHGETHETVSFALSGASRGDRSSRSRAGGNLQRMAG